MIHPAGPEARVVKCSGVIGNPHVVNPSFPEGRPDMFVCGDDDDATRTVTDLCTSLGWPGAVDIGGQHALALLRQ